MDRCPNEILAEIFALACTDDGTTGRSLSLTSRHFRELSAPIQYQSLVIEGHRQITQFLRLLQSEAGSSIRVKQLFISDLTCPEREDPESYHPKYLSSIYDVKTIISLLASHLQILSVVLGTHEGVYTFFSVELPELLELSIYGKLCKQSFPPNSIPAPKLRRLHLSDHHDLSDNFCEALVRLAPNLTHLRVSGVNVNRPHGDLLPALRAFMSQAERRSEDDLNRNTRFPPFLRRIIVCQLAEYRYAEYGSFSSRTRMVRELEKMASEDVCGRLVISQLSPHVDAPGYWDGYKSLHGEAKDEWGSRLDGGSGCWDHFLFITVKNRDVLK